MTGLLITIVIEEAYEQIYVSQQCMSSVQPGIGLTCLRCGMSCYALNFAAHDHGDNS